MTTAIRDRASPPNDFPVAEANGSKRLMTAQEYLAKERLADYKSEFYRGEMIPIPGVGFDHSQISSNLQFNLRLALVNSNCVVLTSDLRVRIPATGLYTYPDLLIVCGEAILEEKELDVLVNPCLISEILSTSTEKYDRGKKFEHYRKLESLKEYLLLSQDRMSAELFTCQADGSWSNSTFEGEDAILELASLSVKIPLVKIYNGVKFDRAKS